jgi:hypothetical protein
VRPQLSKRTLTIFRASAYTRYSFFEWSLILLDITFDSILATDLRESGLRVRRASLHVFSPLNDCVVARYAG